MHQVMPGAGQGRLKAANQLVFALGAGIEALQPFGDGVFDAW